MRSSRRPRRAADGACCPLTCRRPSPCRAASTRNIALALITAEHAVLSEHVMVLVNGVPSQARIVDRPFHDPATSLATGAAQVA